MKTIDRLFLLQSNSQAEVVSHTPGAAAPKTDETKLTEILALLQNLTSTVANYEKHPLLVSRHSLTNFNYSICFSGCVTDR